MLYNHFSDEELIEIVERASTLKERVSKIFLLDEVEKDDPIVNKRIDDWCNIATGGNWKKFEERLDWDGLDLRTVRQVLGSAVHLKDKAEIPSWACALNRYLGSTASIKVEALELRTKGRDQFPFGEIWIPLIDLASSNLCSQAGSCYCLLSEDAHLTMRYQLWRWLFYISSESLELEFSIFQTNNLSTAARLKKALTNSHSNKLYLEFIENLLNGGLKEFFQEYSALARLIAVVIELWVASTLEFLKRLESDQAEIQSLFNGVKELGQVIAVNPSLSDRHNNGRSVIKLTFSCGLKLVYKPKDLGIENAYFELLNWLNQNGAPLPFKLLKVLNRSNYGWVEFLESLPCETKEQVGKYYERSGILLCLVYVLGSTDLHYENIIAHGQHPVLIDLETVMHPQLQEISDLNPNNDVENIANELLSRSVLHTGLLPRWQFNLENQNYDLSGLGASGQDALIRIPKWQNINTDNMGLGHEYIKRQAVTSLPYINGTAQPLHNYIEDIVSGFTQMYGFLTQCKDLLLSPNGPLKALANQKIRFVFRATKVYSFIGQTTLRPASLHFGVDKSLQLEILSRAMVSSDTKPAYWPLLSAEQQALEIIDIPLFSVNSCNEDLKLTSHETISKCFKQSGLGVFTSRLKELNKADLTQQLGIIRGSLFARTVTNDPQPFLPSYSGNNDPEINSTVSAQKMLQQAILIAKEIERQAVHTVYGSAIWIAPQYVPEAECFQLTATGYSLYDGNCGIALFLASVVKITKNNEFKPLIFNALNPIRKGLLQPSPGLNSINYNIGGAIGYGSLIYAFVRISAFIEEPILLEEAKQLAALVTFDLIRSDSEFDIVLGSAGAILGLLALYDNCFEPAILEKAVACGQHLLKNRVVSSSGHKTWATQKGKLLTGFSHGAAGVAYALLRLFDSTKDVCFLKAAEEAIAFENSAFIPERGNWADFRFPKTENGLGSVCTWCHGASGIGLARLGGLKVLDTKVIREDIATAVNTTLKYIFSNEDHLCCGNLGRVEVLLTAGLKLSQPKLIAKAMEQAGIIVGRAKKENGFNYGSSLTFHPGFFQGAAGIGYELLRVAHPTQLPSVLLWE